MPNVLSPSHFAQLTEGSGISSEVVDERGYRSILPPGGYSELKPHGFTRAQANLPGLLLPLWTTDGKNGPMVYRPDEPRHGKDGKPRKYELPNKSGVRVDCPPRCQPKLADPSIPLWVTEGQKKADALATHGLCAIALLGVWNFKGKNLFGGTTILADFDYIALKGRKVRIVFDSDVMTKPEVQRALKLLIEHLQRKGAHVQVVYLPTEGGAKVGVDDYLLTHTVEHLDGLIEAPRLQPQAAKATVTLLDTLPNTMRRPLSLIDGHAYAAAWIPFQREMTESVVKGEIIRHDPPIIQTGRALLIVRDDGVLFGELEDPQIHPMAELGLDVRLPEIPKDDRLWSTRGVKAYRRGIRPEPKEVFGRLVAINDHFLDFDRSLADQQTMCAMLACHELATWFLDAFNVIGYLWPNGGKGSGKTKLEHLVAETAYLGEVILASSTMAVLRDLADYGATLCFDEAERLDSKNADPEKLALLLSGNRRGSTMAVKELAADKHWVTRHVSTYCPRLFSAIRLPGETLESRSIVVPLVRSANRVKANSEVLNPKHWPCPRPALIDDLWALALAHLAEMPGYEDQVNDTAEMSGRMLEPWRPILSVAKWLENTGVEGIYTRMHNLALSYQADKNTIVRDDFASVVIEALHNLHNLHHLHNLHAGGCDFTITTKDVVKEILTFSEPTESETDDPETSEKNTRSLTTKVGIHLRQLRFSRKGQVKRGEPVQWLVSGDVLMTCIFSYGLLSLYPKEGYAGYEGAPPHPSPENSPESASPKNSMAQPPDPQDAGYEGYAGYEVMRGNENKKLPKKREPWAFPRREGLT